MKEFTGKRRGKNRKKNTEDTYFVSHVRTPALFIQALSLPLSLYLSLSLSLPPPLQLCCRAWNLRLWLRLPCGTASARPARPARLPTFLSAAARAPPIPSAMSVLPLLAADISTKAKQKKKKLLTCACFFFLLSFFPFALYRVGSRAATSARGTRTW